MLAEEIIANSIELHLSAALSEENLKVLGDVQHLTQTCLCLLRDLPEFFAAMTDLHDTHACALPIQHLTLGKPEYLFRHA